MNTKRHATRIPTASQAIQARKIKIYTAIEWVLGYTLLFVMSGFIGVALAISLTGGW